MRKKAAKSLSSIDGHPVGLAIAIEGGSLRAQPSNSTAEECCKKHKALRGKCSQVVSRNGIAKQLAYLPLDFETFEAVHAEDLLRARSLFREVLTQKKRGRGRRLLSVLDVLDVACMLEAAPEGLVPESLASSTHMREVRKSVLSSLARELRRFPDHELRIVTIINSAWRFSPKQLGRVLAVDIKQQLLTHLRRAGVLSLDGFIVGFLHGEFEPTSDRFQIHFHLATTERRARAMKAMAGKWGYVPTPTGAAPIVSQRVNDRARQLSYLLKAYWPERPVLVINDKLKRVRETRRIRGLPHSVALLWLHKQPLSALAIVSNATFRRRKIKLK